MGNFMGKGYQEFDRMHVMVEGDHRSLARRRDAEIPMFCGARTREPELDIGTGKPIIQKHF
jgi:hypothetical protein